MQAKLTPFSKNLRKKMTPWETKLWRYLRAKRVWNYKFKRQVPIGDYIVDFCCQKKKLVIELDGGGHSDAFAKTQDQRRGAYLESKGYTILRFWNNEIDKNIEGVLDTINKQLKL